MRAATAGVGKSVVGSNEQQQYNDRIDHKLWVYGKPHFSQPATDFLSPETLVSTIQIEIYGLDGSVAPVAAGCGSAKLSPIPASEPWQKRSHRAWETPSKDMHRPASHQLLVWQFAILRVDLINEFHPFGHNSKRTEAIESQPTVIDVVDKQLRCACIGPRCRKRDSSLGHLFA